jgi:hypothetical protein
MAQPLESLNLSASSVSNCLLRETYIHTLRIPVLQLSWGCQYNFFLQNIKIEAK